MRTIYCPGVDRHVPLRAYVKGVKLAKANPDSEFKQGLTCWWPVTGREIIGQFFEGVQARINEAIPYNRRGK